jgi:hypothetical protein
MDRMGDACKYLEFRISCIVSGVSLCISCALIYLLTA